MLVSAPASRFVLGARDGVGMASVQLAKALRTARVIAGTRGPTKSDIVREFRCRRVADLTRPDLLEALRADVLEWTDFRGVDVVPDPVGGAVFNAAIRCVALRGRYVVLGFAAGAMSVERANYLLLKNMEVSGFPVSEYRDRWPARAAEAQREIFSFIQQGVCRPIVSEAMPLAAVAKALARFETGSARQGRAHHSVSGAERDAPDLARCVRPDHGSSPAQDRVHRDEVVRRG